MAVAASKPTGDKPADTSADAKSDARQPDTNADRDGRSPAAYGVDEYDEDLARNFGFSVIEGRGVEEGEGSREPVRVESVVGLGDTMRERAANRKKLDEGKTQNTTVDKSAVSTK